MNNRFNRSWRSKTISQSPLESRLKEVATLYKQGTTLRSIARYLQETGLETSETSIRRLIRKHKSLFEHKTTIPKPFVAQTEVHLLGDTLKIESNAFTKPDDILVAAGLDPIEWTVERYRTTQKDGKNPTTQTSLSVRRSSQAIVRAATTERQEGRKFSKPKKPKSFKKPILIGIMPDMHCPLEEPVICDGFAAWAKEFQPAKIVNLGDGDDASAFGRHPKNPKYDRPAQEGIDGYYKRLLQQRQAVPDAEIVVLPGNHDHWLQRRVLEYLPALHGLRRAASEEEALSLKHLLRLDELQIEYIDPEGGQYFDSTYTIADDFTLMHGNFSAEYGGATKEIKGWEGSVGQGHDHKLALVAITRRLPDGTEVQRYAASFGTASSRALGYDPKKNVNQGFGVVVLHPDGRWHIEFAYYCPQKNDITWRDWRYGA